VGRYRIVRLLGKGGMGRVYEARDEDLRRSVALKLLPPTVGNNEERRQRFLREARSAAAVTHPNVAVVYDIGESEGRVYIAMELIEGENLRERLGQGPLDLTTAKELAAQVARGLAAAHDKRIVHRDLKPENVMITPSGAVKLLDFGLAKSGFERASEAADAAHADTVTLVTSDEGRILGTPQYMSPEQALGEPLDVRSDVFSLGILLYEMLSGTRPFEGASTGPVLVAIARDPVPPLRLRAPEVDEATEQIVLRCLAKAPAERYANAGEVQRALSGEDLPRPSTATPLSQRQRRPLPQGQSESRMDVAPLTRSGSTGLPNGRRTLVRGLALFALLALGVGGWLWATRGTAPSARLAASAEPSSTPSLPIAPVAAAPPSSNAPISSAVGEPQAPGTETQSPPVTVAAGASSISATPMPHAATRQGAPSPSSRASPVRQAPVPSASNAPPASEPPRLPRKDTML
jgi:serine/threonine protein kinase